MQGRILLVEDDKDIADLISFHLIEAGYSIEYAASGDIGLSMGSSKSYDLFIFDVVVPNLSGIELCKRLRAKSILTPVLFLTSKNSETDKLQGFRVGADDYLTKPFSTMELVARINAIVRRSKLSKPTTSATDIVTIGELSIDPYKRTVSRNGAPVELTGLEFDLLIFLATHPGRPFSRDELLQHVWDYHHTGYEHTVNTHINRLRAKIEENPATPKYILTVWGVGYRFADISEINGDGARAA